MKELLDSDAVEQVITIIGVIGSAALTYRFTSKIANQNREASEKQFNRMLSHERSLAQVKWKRDRQLKEAVELLRLIEDAGRTIEEWLSSDIQIRLDDPIAEAGARCESQLAMLQLVSEPEIFNVIQGEFKELKKAIDRMPREPGLSNEATRRSAFRKSADSTSKAIIDQVRESIHDGADTVPS